MGMMGVRREVTYHDRRQESGTSFSPDAMNDVNAICCGGDTVAFGRLAGYDTPDAGGSFFAGEGET